MATRVIVRCQGLSRRFVRTGLEPVIALDAVDLEIDARCFTVIEGPSGSGKTTLLGLLAGLEPPDAGTITVFGHDLARLSDTERARLRLRRIGIVFQSFGLLADHDAEDNVGMPLLLAGVPADERRARARAALEEVGLAEAATSRIDELSGGERQRIGVARALVANPSLILADEPTGSLDEANGAGVLRLLIEAVRRRDASLVLVTHDPDSARLADQRFHLRDGRLTPGAAA